MRPDVKDAWGLVLMWGVNGAALWLLVYAVLCHVEKRWKAEGGRRRAEGLKPGRVGSLDAAVEPLNEEENEVLLRDACTLARRRPGMEVSVNLLGWSRGLSPSQMAVWLAWARGKRVTLSRAEAGQEAPREYLARVRVDDLDGARACWVGFVAVAAVKKRATEDGRNSRNLLLSQDSPNHQFSVNSVNSVEQTFPSPAARAGATRETSMPWPADPACLSGLRMEETLSMNGRKNA